MIKGQITITSNGDAVTFTPASLRVQYESLAGANSGRTDDGTMKINWKARIIKKLEITLPPYSLDNTEYYSILSLVQGQEYSVTYYDSMMKDWKTENFYTSNTNADFYSGIILNGTIQNCSFNAIGMNSYYKTDSTHATAPIPPHVLPPALSAPTLTLSDNTVSWSAISNAESYTLNIDGEEIGGYTSLSYTFTDLQSHTMKAKAVASGYRDSSWSNTVTYEIPKLSAPVISVSNGVISWTAVTNAQNYLVYDNGTETSQSTTSYTIPSQATHSIKVKATASTYQASDWSNVIAYQAYTISAEATPSGSATVSGTGTYYTGDTCTLTATITTGYSFDGWSDGTPDNPRTITVTGSETFTVECTHISYTISAVVSPSGTATVSGAGNYYYGDTCTLTVTPEEGYLFSQWNDGNTDNPRTIVVTGSATYTVSLVTDPSNYFYVLPASNGTLAYVSKYSGGSSPPIVSKAISYSTDKVNWTNLTSTAVFITAGQKVYLRSLTDNAFFVSASGASRAMGLHVSNTNYSVGGDITSLFNNSTTLPQRALFHFLDSETLLTSASSVIISNALTLGNYCFDSMFNGCTVLTNGVNIPNIILASYCCRDMYVGCTSLTNAPTLNSTTLASSCYSGMFNGCTALVSPPALPATTLVSSCYNSMFYGCTSLTSIPQLPATTLANSCYSNMFQGCTSLTETCYISPSIIGNNSCMQMFYSAGVTLSTTPSSSNKNIWRIPMVGTTTVGSNSFSNMFSGITPTANTVYFANGTSPYYSIYWASSPSYGDENWDVMGSEINVDFYCDGVLYNQIYCSPDGGLDYINTVTGVTLTACDYQTGWVSQQYRAIYYTSDMSFGSSDWYDFLLANDLLYSL